MLHAEYAPEEAPIWAIAEVGNPARPRKGDMNRPVSVIRAHKILVVDDELWSALDMEWVVNKLGYDVIGPVATAQEAISLAGETKPDLVLMDIRLANGSDGIDAALVLKQQFGVSCIFVSAHADPDTRSRAAMAYPYGFIEKPFTPQTLANAIERALRPLS